MCLNSSTDYPNTHQVFVLELTDLSRNVYDIGDYPVFGGDEVNIRDNGSSILRVNTRDMGLDMGLL